MNFLLRNNKSQEKKRKMFVSDMNIGAYGFIYLVTYFKITVMSPIPPLFLFMWILRKYSMYLKCLDTPQELIPPHKIKETVLSTCVHKQKRF